MSENTITSEQLTRPQSLLGTLERRLKNYHGGEYGKQQFTLTVELKLIKQIKEALANEPRKDSASEVRVDALVRFLERHRHDIAELFLHKVQDEMEVEYKNETFDGNEVYFQNAGKIGFDVVDEIISLAKAKDT